jgi:UDP-3-O-[3-hydroxymyristoyl] glucosamine N-acyltransferase
MTNSNFFNKKKEFFTLKEVLKITDSVLCDNKNFDLDKKIYNVKTIESADQDDLSFFHSAAYLQKLLISKAGFCFMEKKFVTKAPKTMIAIINPNPYFAYATFIEQFYVNKNLIKTSKSISPKATIQTSSIIGEGAVINAGAYVGDNVKIGKNCFIGPNSVIEEGCEIGDNAIISALVTISHCTIGNNVIIHNGAKIGQDGFGFANNAKKLQKVMQLGVVIIGDDVEIGANSCIDRGASDNTVIGNQVKIDNLVQIGHNVIIGEGTVIAGCAGVAGSAKIGKFVQIGGSAMINGHITIGDGAKVAGGSGVVRSVDPMSIVGGFPSMPVKDWHRINIKLSQMIKKYPKPKK